MSEEPTTPAADVPEYQIFEIFAHKDVYEKILLAMKYVGETNPEAFVADCVKQQVLLIDAACHGELEKGLVAASESLQAAAKFGEQWRQNQNPSPPRPELTVHRGGKA